MKKIILLLCASIFFTGCQRIEKESDEMKMIVQVKDTDFVVSLENNEACQQLVEMLKEKPIILSLSDYSGFEKVGYLGFNLPTSNRHITTESGDIVLYNGNQIVIFYGSNSWSYTKLGKIDNLSGWKEALGNGDVSITLTLE